MENENNNLFQVNLKGMIALLSEHIYSNPNTFVRELLQNCVDAITALRNIDENYSGQRYRTEGGRSISFSDRYR